MKFKNYGVATGRTVAVSFFPIKGGELARVKIAVQRDYIPKGAKEAPADYIEMTGFIRSEDGSRGIYGYIRTGDLMSVQYTVQSSVSEKNGEKQYYQNLIIEHLEFLESKAVRDARHQEKIAAKK